MSDTNEMPQMENLSIEETPVEPQDFEHDPETKDDEPQQIRCLIDNSQVGGIIGKGGANVKRVREETNVFLSILKGDTPAVKERIMVLKGTIEQISKAARMIAELLIEAASQRDLATDGAPIKLLVHRYKVGAIIGKGGAVIKDTQTETETRIQISQEVLGQSTEKSVTVTGSPGAIEHAMTLIMEQLASSPLRDGTKNYPYTPGPPATSPMYSPFAPQPFALYGQAPLSPYAMSSGAAPGMLPQGNTSTQKIAIPTVCAGCVIGKGGAVIRDIRIQSQTNISIADAENTSPAERVVTLSGTPQGIQTAIYLIRQLVEQYQPQAF